MQRFRGLKAAILALAITALAAQAQAQPTLQLDIGGGTYDNVTETIVAQSNPFTLYALLIPDNTSTISDTYYISAALIPQTSSGTGLGSFVFNGNTVNTTSMTYGTPPIDPADQTHDPGDLPTHGIFPTLFEEFSFQFSSSNTATAYNTQDNAGQGPIPNPSGTMYYAAFNVDVSNLSTDYVLHFDLYNTETDNGDIDITANAPFSHDAQSGPRNGNGNGNGNGNHEVPEPGVLALLGMGIAGMVFGRKKQA